jgi:lysophospholipase L1-like esterase
MKFLKSKTISFSLASIFALIQLFLISQLSLNAFCLFAPKVETLAENGTVKDVCCTQEESSTNGEEEEQEEETTDEETSQQQQEESQNGETTQDGNGSKQQEDEEQPQPEPEPEPPPPEPTVIQCLGDSITYGSPYGGSSSTYPARLQAKLDAAYGAGTTTVVNRGVGGYRADQVLASVGGWLQADNPDIVLLKIGGNDLLQETVPQTPEKFLQVVSQTKTEVQQIVNVVKAHINPDGSHPKVILSAFIPNLYEGVLGSAGIAYYNTNLSAVSNVDRYFTSNWNSFYDSSTGQAKAYGRRVSPK